MLRLGITIRSMCNMKSIEIIKCMLNNIFILMHITHYFFFLELRDGLVFISTIGGVFSTGTGS